MQMKTILKSIGAALAGMIAGAILSVGTDTILETSGIFPSFADQQANGSPTWLLLWATLYRTIYTVIGCYITARLAPHHPLRHAVIVGCIGCIASIAGGLAMWHLGQHWYPIILGLLSLPAGWAGGMLYERQKGH